jgi:ATP-dependent RNA helicase DDX55/SPB4
VRETRRVASLAESETAKAKERRAEENAKRRESKERNAAWSINVTRKVEREKRKGKKVRKREWLKGADVGEGEAGGRAEGATQEQPDHLVDNADSKKRGAGDTGSGDDDDWNELAREERMAKKVRKGKMDGLAFDAEFGGL